MSQVRQFLADSGTAASEPASWKSGRPSTDPSWISERHSDFQSLHFDRCRIAPDSRRPKAIGRLTCRPVTLQEFYRILEFTTLAVTVRQP